MKKKKLELKEQVTVSGQPGSVQSTGLEISEGRLYRASLHTELQKFGDSTRLSLLDDTSTFEPVEVTGLDLSVAQDKALSAIQILLDRTGHSGNRPGTQARADGYRGQPVPRLAFTYAEYFEAYGLKKATGGWRHQHQEALKALRDLAEPRWRIAYKRRRWEGKGQGQGRKQVYDVIAPEEPVSLLTIMKAYKGLDGQEVARLESGEKLSGRERGLVVDLHPILVDQIRRFGLLKSTALHQEIQQLMPGKRKVSRTISLLIQWLTTLSLPTITISEDNLLQKLHLYESFYQHRNKARIRHRLQEAFDMALKLQYLLEPVEQTDTGNYVLVPNPARCRRVKPEPGGQDE